MKFHALLVVRDEADIIEQSLRHLVSWADAVYVFDTGSCDKTWDLIQQFAASHRNVQALAHDAVYFSDKRLRGWLFHRARQHMREGDWFVRVDADEFYHIPPPEFVKLRMRKHETIAYHQYFNFHLTTAEAAAWEQGQETLADRKGPIEQRRRWFTISSYTEPRLCRYRQTMQWPETVSFPHNAGFLAVERLPVRHYPHRDPLQLQRRCRLRVAMMTNPENACNRHWHRDQWRHHLVEETHPGLKRWTPGTDLPEPCFRNHLANPAVRFLQRMVHAAFLPVLDRCRATYGDQTYPVRIPVEVQERLRCELA
jgi:glycosyltransferase involved in cell wall biosynthesis